MGNPFPTLLHLTNQRVKMPRLREDPWVGNPFPTLLHLTNQRVKMPRLREDPWVGNPFPALTGSPVHDLHFIGPDEMMPRMFGIRSLGAANLTGFSYLYFLNRAHRSHAMPHQLEGFKLANGARGPLRRLAILMIFASALGAVSSFWAFLSLGYWDCSQIWRSPLASCRDSVLPWTGTGRISGRNVLERVWYHPRSADVPIPFLISFFWNLCYNFPVGGVSPLPRPKSQNS